jgi:hypothetical protein
MARKHRVWAYYARLKLIKELGDACAECKHKGSKKNPLTIDHINGRMWDGRKKDPSWRVSIYRREAKEGKLQVLCKSCNEKKGGPLRYRNCRESR